MMAALLLIVLFCTAGGLLVFSLLFFLDVKGEEQRVQKRQEVRDAQIMRGDRTVERSSTGELVSSKLKPVSMHTSNYIDFIHMSSKETPSSHPKEAIT